MNELGERVRKLRRLERACDCVLLYNEDRWTNPNFAWLANVPVNGWLLAAFFGKPRIFVNEMCEPETTRSWVKPTVIKSFAEIEEHLPKGRIGVDASRMSAKMLDAVRAKHEVVDVSNELEVARSVKTRREIGNIRAVCKITEKLMDKIRVPYSGSEAALRADLEWEMGCMGLEPAFPTIVASGKNIATPHHVPTKHQAKAPLLVDMGVRCNGYCSDVTRTYGSKYQGVINNVFDVVEPMLEPGARCADIDAAARKAMGGSAKYFITSLGHGVGVAVHEFPRVSSGSKDVLEIGNVITIEPGIYVPNGIRHENMYLIIERGSEKLTCW